MKRLAQLLALTIVVSLSSCGGESNNYRRGVYLLLDTSGTYTKELDQAKKIINYLLANMEAGDVFAVARIDSGSFSEKDIIASVTLDSRPSAAIRQKQAFAARMDEFVKTVNSSAYTDISGGLLQAIEYLNGAEVGKKRILIFSDLQEELPKEFVRNFDLPLSGFSVNALNVTKLRSDNVNPQEYLDRVEDWQRRVVTGGGDWSVINDLERIDKLAL